MSRVTEHLLVAPTSHALGVLLHAMLGLRYRVAIAGRDHVRRARGTLLLANHPAEIDPALLVVFLWFWTRPRPVVLESVYQRPSVHWLLWLNHALPIPDLETDRTAAAVRRLRACLEELGARLRQGQNVLLYPSGRLSRDGRETIGNAAGTQMILARNPETPVVLIRTRGLWGSSFSCVGGDKPDLEKAMANGVRSVLRHGLFFGPRRRVSITCVPAPADFPRQAPRHELNAWLEAWWAQDGPEPATAVAY